MDAGRSGQHAPASMRDEFTKHLWLLPQVFLPVAYEYLFPKVNINHYKLVTYYIYKFRLPMVCFH